MDTADLSTAIVIRMTGLPDDLVYGPHLVELVRVDSIPAGLSLPVFAYLGPGLDDGVLAFLSGLVAADIRKRGKTIDRFAPREDQDPDEAADVLAGFRSRVAWRRGVLGQLAGLTGDPASWRASAADELPDDDADDAPEDAGLADRIIARAGTVTFRNWGDRPLTSRELSAVLQEAARAGGDITCECGYPVQHGSGAAVTCDVCGSFCCEAHHQASPRYVRHDLAGVPGSDRSEITPDLLSAARSWIADCEWVNLGEDDVADLADAQVMSGIRYNYEGGWPQFMRDSGTRWAPATDPVAHDSSGPLA